MDSAAQAAIIGALVGSASSFLTAIITARTQRDIAGIAARAEMRKLRQEPRAKAYQLFFKRTPEFTDTIPRLLVIESGNLLYPARVSREQGERAETACTELRSVWEEIALLGPPKVSSPATEIARLATEAKNTISALVSLSSESDDRRAKDDLKDHISKLFQKLEEFERAISDRFDEFISEAEAALDDDGSRRRR
ncbi:hypothetical protein H4W23_39720 [Streptomyces gardneri]|uniref:hypothetical protein n=1 Tax=Streptomyces gardneri TaxID=66892 RepID=UPI0012660879|nr:hypothetical protein [Streptomyces gardneri]QPK50122.1 hypothetical protein H4W23_39720 [Streptomyces gardneri]WRK41711.1 hypothetical protein U0M97_39950 [Streptomyces venezuelae]